MEGVGWNLSLLPHLLDEAGGKIGTLLVKEGLADLHALAHLRTRVGTQSDSVMPVHVPEISCWERKLNIFGTRVPPSLEECWGIDIVCMRRLSP
jgi:hypothetical protein